MSAVNRLKAGLLEELRLMRAQDWEAYWQQAKWPKPNLTRLTAIQVVTHQENGKRAEMFSPLSYALSKLDPAMLAVASGQPDPFGWLLEQINVVEWAEFCRAQNSPWMARIWLAAASQLRAELRLTCKAHGWSDSFHNLKSNPTELKEALDFFVAQLSHASVQRGAELKVIRLAGLSETQDRRLRRARQSRGVRAGVSPAEQYLVQHWLEQPHGFPGLCFFNDTAIHSLLVILGLVRKRAEAHITTLMRCRIGLVQAGVKVHFIERVDVLADKLTFAGRKLKVPYVCAGEINWGARKLWPL
jgi:hypothetical protein